MVPSRVLEHPPDGEIGDSCEFRRALLVTHPSMVRRVRREKRRVPLITGAPLGPGHVATRECSPATMRDLPSLRTRERDQDVLGVRVPLLPCGDRAGRGGGSRSRPRWAPGYAPGSVVRAHPSDATTGSGLAHSPRIIRSWPMPNDIRVLAPRSTRHAANITTLEPGSGRALPVRPRLSKMRHDGMRKLSKRSRQPRTSCLWTRRKPSWCRLVQADPRGRLHGEPSPQVRRLIARQPPARLLAMIWRNMSPSACVSIGSPWRSATVRAVVLSWPAVTMPAGSGTMPPS